MTRIFRKPELSWLVAAALASVLLAGALFVPLWQMELKAPQYPEGLVMKAYGYKFVGSPNSHYDDVKEINGLNHYIGMDPIKKVFEMKLFIPGVIALIGATALVSFIAWKRWWLRGLIIAGFWSMPLFFVADLQFWLYRYGHSMNPEAPLNPGAFTPKVVGTTKVWNFHSVTGFDMGFYLMLAAALAITIIPAGTALYRSRATRATEETAHRTPGRLVPHRGI